MAESAGSAFLTTVDHYFENAAKFLNHPRGLLDQIKECNSVYCFKFPVRHGDSYEVVYAWRVEHSHHKLPVKGGIRFSETADEDDVLLENRKVPDLRTAAFMSAINKVAVSYIELGIFP